MRITSRSAQMVPYSLSSLPIIREKEVSWTPTETLLDPKKQYFVPTLLRRTIIGLMILTIPICIGFGNFVHSNKISWCLTYLDFKIGLYILHRKICTLDGYYISTME